MIDFDLEIRNVKPINVNDIELMRLKVNDNICDSIILYNKAITEINTNNINEAIKSLKKALSKNQGFAEATKLLGLCYVNNNQNKKAEKIFKNMIKYGLYGDLAREYINELIAERNMTTTVETVTGVRVDSYKEKKLSILNSPLKGKTIMISSILIIAISGLAITYRLVVKHPTASKNNEAFKHVVNSADKNNKNSSQDKVVAKKNTSAVKDNKNIKNQLVSTVSAIDYNKNNNDIKSMLNEAEIAFRNKNYEKAANSLLLLKNMTFDHASKIKFNRLWSDMKLRKIWTIYNQGGRLYKEKKYQEALPKLKIAYEISPDKKLMPWITYQIAVCYKKTNDDANALVFFEKVINDYPKSEYSSNSERMIKLIEKKKFKK